MDNDWDERDVEHPEDEPRFALAYDDYPGGESAYWRDFKAATRLYYKALGDDWDRSPEQYAEEQACYMLRRRVHDVAQEFARTAGIAHRNLSHWLVKVKGYPWRGDCDFDQLRSMLRLLEDPAAIEEARKAPNYPDLTSPEAIRAATAYWDQRLAERRARS